MDFNDALEDWQILQGFFLLFSLLVKYRKMM
jgi:hypothetical protein